MGQNILIGIGNILFCDDGIGVKVVEYLKSNYRFEPDLELLDGGTLGFGLLEYFTQYERVFIVDTISIDDCAGEFYEIPSDELLGGNPYKKTAHEVEVLQMLEVCELYDKKAEVVVLGIVPDDITSAKIGLSQILNEKFSDIIFKILLSLKRADIESFKLKEL
ncbi:MAG: HyaD/HybD family hydrogenase maturation endopeptidase [Campylobacterota bacterium]|nr:HyaD/HybD family hydrogenase maturation endopeptidase [Campylobacterota bacterium]